MSRVINVSLLKIVLPFLSLMANTYVLEWYVSCCTNTFYATKYNNFKENNLCITQDVEVSKQN